MTKLSMVVLILACCMIPLSASADQVGGGDLTFTPPNTSPVVFSHEKHISSGKNLKCTNCHYQIFQMARDSYKMDMSRITKGEFCGKCHNGNKAFDVKDQKNCARCHR